MFWAETKPFDKAKAESSSSDFETLPFLRGRLSWVAKA
jgi:hypothetical protein